MKIEKKMNISSCQAFSKSQIDAIFVYIFKLKLCQLCYINIYAQGVVFLPYNFL